MKVKFILFSSLIIMLGLGATAKVSTYPKYRIRDLAGKSYSPKGLRGKAVFLTFFARTCKPCKEEVPFLNNLQKKYPDTLSIIGIAFKEDDPKKLGDLGKEWKINYPICLDPDGNGARAFRVNTLPRGFLLDQKGKLLAMYEGMTEQNKKGMTGKLASLQADIKSYQTKGPKFYVAVFEESNDKAAGEGKVWQSRITEWLKGNNIPVSSSQQDADYVISGSITKISDIVGIEIIVTHSSGMQEITVSDSVIGGDDSRVKKLLIENLRTIPYTE